MSANEDLPLAMTQGGILNDIYMMYSDILLGAYDREGRLWRIDFQELELCIYAGDELRFQIKVEEIENGHEE